MVVSLSKSPAVLWIGFVLICAPIAHAGGPRWFTGAPFYTAPAGNPVVFFTTDPLYYTDPGALNANVSHAQADAMVAAAATTWNVPTSRLTLAQGGTLAEHVSSNNTYFDGTNVIFPDDVKLANYFAKPIVIVYDTDGSVIDLLLGSGASDPSGCRQNGVVESVDGLDPAGTIDHALLILNGRCVGANSDQLTQMQYQLMRAFGRVIGLAWSQLNDNVFTGIPAPTAVQMQNWPVMHPIDVLCGPYTFKCMSQPFVLRADDLSSLARLYPVTSNNISPGKSLTGDGALILFGFVTFPTGQGMNAVNVTLRRRIAFTNPDQYAVVSAVTGAMYQQFLGSPITGPASGVEQSSGGTDTWREGIYWMQRVPIEGPVGWESLYATTEPINPLYSGEYAIGAYIGDPTAMSGSAVTVFDGLEAPGRFIAMNAAMDDAPNSCNTGNDGSESGPVPADPSGWWTGLLCSNYHSAWLSHSTKPGRSWTVEMTALDERGIPTTAKTRGLIGVWNAADAVGSTPTVALTPSPLNAMNVGMTQLLVDASATPQSYRIALGDQRGQGRPDFVYRARILYADAISPAQLGVSGGRIIISGEGFRAGNVVRINGVIAPVVSWSSTRIIATAPNMQVANMTPLGTADVAIIDTGTGGTTIMQSALSYGGAGANSIAIISVPTQVQTGTISSLPFAIRVLSTDGVTPAPGATVQMSATGGGVLFTSCGSPTCLLTTDANGFAQSWFTANTAGAMTLTAIEQSGGASVQATLSAVAPLRVLQSQSATRYLAAGAATSLGVSVLATQDGVPVAGQVVSWTGTSGLTSSLVLTITDANGTASTIAHTAGLGAGQQATLQGCTWTNVCAGTSAFGVDPAQFTIAAITGAGQSVQAAVVLAPVVLQVTDLAGHPIVAAQVNIFQTLDAWEGPCPPQGRCAAAPVLGSSQQMLTTNAGGFVSIIPLNLPGTASTVHIAAVTGTQGFISLSLTKVP